MSYLLPPGCIEGITRILPYDPEDRKRLFLIFIQVYCFYGSVLL